MTARTLEIDTIFLLSISAIAGVVFAVSSNHKPNISYSFSVPVIETSQNPISILNPVPTTKTSSQISPDGTKILKMTTITNKDTTTTYSLIASNSDGQNQQSIYATTLPSTESITIPFNTWSPDNKYVFIQHNILNGSEALVMDASGKPLVQGEQYFNAASLFTAKSTGNTYQEATGWASETLLIINTLQQDGSKGPSYWLEIPSKAIIQLSTQF